MFDKDYEKEMRRMRNIAKYDQDGFYAPVAMRITIRNGARGGGIMRRGPFGRNVHCYFCNKAGEEWFIGYNNETGTAARNDALEIAGSHLEKFHPEHVETVLAAHKKFLATQREQRKNTAR